MKRFQSFLESFQGISENVQWILGAFSGVSALQVCKMCFKEGSGVYRRYFRDFQRVSVALYMWFKSILDFRSFIVVTGELKESFTGFWKHVMVSQMILSVVTGSFEEFQSHC